MNDKDTVFLKTANLSIIEFSENYQKIVGWKIWKEEISKIRMQRPLRNNRRNRLGGN